jgi:histidyl-tRNA synthetase
LGTSLSVESQQRFDSVLALLADLGISYEINPKLVRGLDYYSHTAFEFQSVKFGAVGGGGRYDGLVQELGGPETPAIGWAIGLERLIGLLQEMRSAPESAMDVYIVSRGEKAEAQALGIAQKLRSTGLKVEMDLSGSAFNKQFGRADRSGAKVCVIVGESEAESGMAQVKWLGTGEQVEMAQADLVGLRSGF